MINTTDDGPPPAEQCGTSVHATEALLTIVQEQKIKQAMASSYIAPSPGALEGRSLQIYDLDQSDQICICKGNRTPVFKLHERFASIYCNALAPVAMGRSLACESQPDESIIFCEEQDW